MERLSPWASDTCPSDPGGEKLGVCRELGQTEIGGSREEGGAVPRRRAEVARVEKRRYGR